MISNQTSIESQNSGSTFCSLVLDRNVVFCANAGDSRAVKYSIDASFKRMEVQALSTDHKPSDSFEKQRIRAMNGRVKALRDQHGKDVGPERVWLMEQDSPGLAMSRSLGDEIAHSVGVSENPEVFRYDLGPDDKFIVIASDGVWEFMSNEEIGEIVWPFYLQNSPEQAGNAIVRAAAKRWRSYDSNVDDITCITIFLEVDNQLPQPKPSNVPFFSAN